MGFQPNPQGIRLTLVIRLKPHASAVEPDVRERAVRLARNGSSNAKIGVQVSTPKEKPQYQHGKVVISNLSPIA